MEAFNSPFIVPLGAFAVAIAAILGGIIAKVRTQQIQADQRLGMLARGIPIAEVERVLGNAQHGDAPLRSPWNPTRSATMMRRTGLILIFSGLGIVAFFVALVIILHEKEVYSGAAVGLVPIFIGIGFLVDYRLQVRDLARLRDETGL